MTRRIISTATTAIAIVAFAAPIALARPADMPPAVAKATAKAERGQDLRHLRAGVASVGMYTTGATPAVTYTSGTDAETARPLPGPPTWPTHPEPITAAPAIKASDGKNGIAGTTIALGIAGSLLAIAAIAGITSHTRRAGRARITA